MENFDIKKNSPDFFLQIENIQNSNIDIPFLEFIFESFERVLEINIFNSDINYRPTSIHINSLNNSILIVFFKMNSNNKNELIFCEIKIKEIKIKLEIIKKIICVIYNNYKENIDEEKLKENLNDNNSLSILTKNPLFKYIEYLRYDKYKSSFFNKEILFKIDDLNILAFLKCPITNSKFDKEIFEICFNLEIDNFSYNQQKYNHLKNLYTKEILLEFYNNKYFEILNIFKINFKFLLTEENFASPSFIEIDELNGALITKNPSFQFKIWDFKNYLLLFDLCDIRVQEIRITNDIFITLSNDNEFENNNILLNVYEINTGKLIANYKLKVINQNNQIEIIEFFQTKMLIKLLNESPKLIDLISGEINFIDENISFDENSLFFYLDEIKKFLCLNKNIIFCFNLNGELDRKIMNSNIKELNTDYICFSNNKKYMAVFWENIYNENIKESQKESNYLNTEVNRIHDLNLINSLEILNKVELGSPCNNKISLNWIFTEISDLNKGFQIYSSEEFKNKIQSSKSTERKNTKNKIQVRNFSDNFSHLNKSSKNNQVFSKYSKKNFSENNCNNLSNKTKKENTSFNNFICDSVIRNLENDLDNLINSSKCKSTNIPFFSFCKNDYQIKVDYNDNLRSNFDMENNFKVSHDYNSFLLKDKNDKDDLNVQNTISNDNDYEFRTPEHNLINFNKNNLKNIRKFKKNVNIINSIKKHKKFKFKGEIQIILLNNNSTIENEIKITNDNLFKFENFFISDSNQKEIEIEIKHMYFEELNKILIVFGKEGEMFKIIV